MRSYPFLDVRQNRDFISTKDGRIGYGPPGVEPGDVVCIFEGSVVPFVLRYGSQSGTAMLVGEAYVHGIMNEEVFDLAREGVVQLSTIPVS